MKLAGISFAAFVLCIGLLVSPGCDEGNDATLSSTTAVTPPEGSYVHVQFRRDYLGLAGEKQTAPMQDGMASSGQLKRVTSDFIVLQVDNEPDRELWIPREAVLLMDVRRKP